MRLSKEHIRSNEPPYDNFFEHRFVEAKLYEVSSSKRKVASWTKSKFSNSQYYDHSAHVECDSDEVDDDVSLCPDQGTDVVDENNNDTPKKYPEW